MAHLRSWGNPTPGNAAYGATKRALPQLKDSLAAEAAAAEGGVGSKVGVHIVSPGMVATELLFRYADTPRKGEARSGLAACMDCAQAPSLPPVF